MDDQYDSKSRHEPLESRVHGNMQARFGKGQSETDSNAPRWLPTSQQKLMPPSMHYAKNAITGNPSDVPTFLSGTVTRNAPWGYQQGRTSSCRKPFASALP